MSISQARSLQKRYRVAALSYLLYGIVYFLGAALRMTPERQVHFHGLPWWSFFLGGAVLLGVIPYFIWHGRKWLTRIIAFGPAAKCLVLVRREFLTAQSDAPIDSFNVVFALIAFLAAFLLFRAGFSRKAEP